MYVPQSSACIELRDVTSSCVMSTHFFRMCAASEKFHTTLNSWTTQRENQRFTRSSLASGTLVGCSWLSRCACVFVDAVKRIQLQGKRVASNLKIIREVTTIARLQHQYIVRYFHAWIEGAKPLRFVYRLVFCQYQSDSYEPASGHVRFVCLKIKKHQHISRITSRINTFLACSTLDRGCMWCLVFIMRLALWVRWQRNLSSDKMHFRAKFFNPCDIMPGFKICYCMS